MPLKDFQCRDCGHIQEELVSAWDDVNVICNHCECTKMVALPGMTGGYKFTNGSGGASRTPKDAGSPRRSKK